MAKMRAGPIVGDMSGSLGAVTISRGKTGNVMRTRTKPIAVLSEARARSQGAMSAASRGWGGLTAVQRAAWNTFAQGYSEPDVLGSVRTLRGYDWYRRLNARLELMGESMLSTPPAAEPESKVFDAVMLCSAASIVPIVQVNQFRLEVASAAWIWFAAMYGGNGRRWQDQLKLIVREGLPSATGLFFAFGEYQERFGPLVEGQKVYAVVRKLDFVTGFLSPPTLLSATCGP